MFQAATANWNPSSEGRTRTASNDVVASLQTASLVETQDHYQTVAMTTPAPFASSPSAQSAASHGMDTAVMALGLIGAWMMLIGMAMISRRFRLVKTGGALASSR